MRIFRRKQFLRHDSDTGLRRVLGLKDLVALGIAAVIGAGIFGTIGEAAASGGPAVVFLFIITAVACLFSALCYAQFASSIPEAGSAYTYAYASFGELAAWIIGWDLIMEYAIGNIAVAISWSDYFSGFLQGFDIHLPHWLCMDYRTAWEGYQSSLVSGHTLSPPEKEALQAWLHCPKISGIPVIIDLPAFLITVFITIIVYIGIKESKRLSNALVAFKVLVILLFIIVGFYYVEPDHWSPFMPNGWSGVFGSVAAVFFAYIGFDAISTTTEECLQPERDLPRAMLWVLGICTTLYILTALVLTGMLPYNLLNVGDPIAYVFKIHHLNFLSGIFSFSALIAMTSVLLVFQLGQPRIWMSMSRDKLLPDIFSKIHPKYKTPSFSTLLTGAMVGLPALFMNLKEVTDLCAIGTLFAFVLVCGGILVQQHTNTATGTFRVPFINANLWILPAFIIVLYFSKEHFAKVYEHIVLSTLEREYVKGAYEFPWYFIPELFFYLVFLTAAIWTLFRKVSLLPLLGLLSNLWLMSQLGLTNWLRFGIWLIIGLVIYFGYSYRRK